MDKHRRWLPSLAALGISARAGLAAMALLLASPLVGPSLGPGAWLGKALGPGGAAWAQVAAPGNRLGTAPPPARLWRDIRRGRAGAPSGTAIGTGVLVQSEGQRWRELHNRRVRPYGGWALLGSLGAVALFFALRGRVRLDGPRTGRRMARFTQAERVVHWYVAGLFVLLAVSGLTLMFGRGLLLPVMGKSAYGALASAMLQGHNLFGPLFIAGILVMAALFLKDNLPQKGDLLWIAKGGPWMRSHAPSWKYNIAEKAWYWLAVVAGLVLSASGLVMEFPWVFRDISWIQLANLSHGIAALAIMAVALGHIYLGTIGVEGALEGMTTGSVEEAWAFQHHEMWARETAAGSAGARGGTEAESEGARPGAARAGHAAAE